MHISFKVIDNTLLVVFKGELDHHSTVEVRKKIDSHYKEKRLKNIIFDLSVLKFMDSAGIGLVMGRYKLVSQNNGKVCLINASSRVEKILNMSGVVKIVNIYDDLKEALDKLEGKC